MELSMRHFYFWNVLLLFGADFVRCSFWDKYNIMNAMASRCKQYVCADDYNYTTFYKVNTTGRKLDPGVAFEMHLAILAPNNAHILLSSVDKPESNDAVYEIAIGAGDNNFTELRKKQGGDTKVWNDTVGILSRIDYKAFWIKVMEGGLIEFGREDDSTPVLRYEDPDPLPVRFFSFTAWFDSQVTFLYDCRFDQNEADYAELYQPPDQKKASVLFTSPPSVPDNSEQPYRPLDQENESAPDPSSTTGPDNSEQPYRPLDQENVSAPDPSSTTGPDNSEQPYRPLDQENVSAPYPSSTTGPDISEQPYQPLDQSSVSAPVPSPTPVLDNSEQPYQPLDQRDVSAPIPSPTPVPDTSEQPYQPFDLRNVTTQVPSPTPVLDNNILCPPHPPCPIISCKELYHDINQKNMSVLVPAAPSVPDISKLLYQPSIQKNVSATVPSPPPVPDNSEPVYQPSDQRNVSAAVPPVPAVPDNSKELYQAPDQRNMDTSATSPTHMPDNSKLLDQSDQKNVSTLVLFPPSVPDDCMQLYQLLYKVIASDSIPSQPSVPDKYKQPFQPAKQTNINPPDPIPPSAPDNILDKIKKQLCTPHPPCPTLPDIHMYHSTVQSILSASVPTPSSVPRFINPYPDNYIRWVPSNKSKFQNLNGKALIAGHEDLDGITSPLWIIRARHAGDLLPGKLDTKIASAYVPYHEKEILIDKYEVLCVNPSAVHWVPASFGDIPPKAVVGGETVNREKLYIGRKRHEGTLIPGKIHPKNRRLYISYASHEISFSTYEVLVRV